MIKFTLSIALMANEDSIEGGDVRWPPPPPFHENRKYTRNVCF